jgi:iron-sulfur cluster repair protein YtfE (RIC family)
VADTRRFSRPSTLQRHRPSSRRSMADPVRILEHTHGNLRKLAPEIGRLLRIDPKASQIAETRRTLIRRLEQLRDDLLGHFANEEEGLFPFIRANVPAKIEAVGRLEAAHDTICGAIVRVAHLVARDRAATRDASIIYERFEAAYAAHSRDEAALFEELEDTLTKDQRRGLADFLRGLA